MFIRILFAFFIFKNIAFADFNTPREQIFDNVKVYSLEDNFLPIISINIAFKNVGVAYQESDLVGINSVISYLCNNFLFLKDREYFANEIANRNISINFSNDMENFYISLNFTRSDQDLIVKFLNEFFNEFELLDSDINKAIQYIDYAKSNSYLNSNFVSNQNLKNKFFEPPFNRDGFIKNEENIQINQKSIKNFIQTLKNKNRLRVAVVGDIKQSELEDLIKNIFSDFSSDIYSQNIIASVQNPVNSIEYFAGYDQIVFYSAIKGVPRNAENFYAFYLFNHLVGGSARNSLISTKLREDEGLTYSSYSYVNYLNNFGYMVLYFATDKAKYHEAKNVYFNLLDEIKAYKFTQEDLDVAKKFLMGKYDITFTSNSKISGFLMGLMLFDLPANMLIDRNNFIEAITLDDIFAVRKEIFSTQNFTNVITGEIN